jgi:hypothetical protein
MRDAAYSSDRYGALSCAYMVETVVNIYWPMAGGGGEYCMKLLTSQELRYVGGANFHKHGPRKV